MSSMLPDNHVYSYTQLTSFCECPFSFYMARIERAPQKSNAFSEQGTLIHDLIEKWAKGELAREQLAAEYERRYADEVVTAFPRMLATRGYAEKAYQLGLSYFENFRGFPGYKIIGVEQKFRTEIAGRPFVGVIDMVLQDLKTDKLIILDHKSKSLSSFKKNEDEMYKQQYLYSLYIKDKYDTFPEKLMFNLFKEGGMLMERQFDEATFCKVLQWAEDTIKAIEECDMVDWLTSKEKSDFFCQELCSVRGECPNGK